MLTGSKLAFQLVVLVLEPRDAALTNFPLHRQHLLLCCKVTDAELFVLLNREAPVFDQLRE